MNGVNWNEIFMTLGSGAVSGAFCIAVMWADVQWLKKTADRHDDELKEIREKL